MAEFSGIQSQVPTSGALPSAKSKGTADPQLPTAPASTLPRPVSQTDVSTCISGAQVDTVGSMKVEPRDQVKSTVKTELDQKPATSAAHHPPVYGENNSKPAETGLNGSPRHRDRKRQLSPTQMVSAGAMILYVLALVVFFVLKLKQALV